MTEFCGEHSNVVGKLGELRQGQNDMKDILIEIKTKIDNINGRQVDVRLSAATEKTKSSILYWVFAVAAGGLILGAMNMIFKALGIWNLVK